MRFVSIYLLVLFIILLKKYVISPKIEENTVKNQLFEIW